MSEPSRWQPWKLQNIITESSMETDNLINSTHVDYEASQAQSANEITDDDLEKQTQYLKSLEEKATQEGYEAGYQAGSKAGFEEASQQVLLQNQAELNERIEILTAPLDALVSNFCDALKLHEKQLITQLTNLAIEAGQVLAGQALALKPEYILDDVEQLMSLPIEAASAPVLFLCTEDFALVEKNLSMNFHALGWKLKIDSRLSRGDCRIESDEQIIDATTTDRFARIRMILGQKAH